MFLPTPSHLALRHHGYCFRSLLGGFRGSRAILGDPCQICTSKVDWFQVSKFHWHYSIWPQSFDLRSPAFLYHIMSTVPVYSPAEVHDINCQLGPWVNLHSSSVVTRALTTVRSLVITSKSFYRAWFIVRQVVSFYR